MTYVPPSFGRPVLCAYLLGAAALGFSAPIVGAAFASRPGAGTLAEVVAVLVGTPALVFALAVAYPRITYVLSGTTIATWTVLAAAALGSTLREGRARTWTVPVAGASPVPIAFSSVPSAALLSWPMYVGFGLLGAWLSRPWRRVGFPEAGNCRGCGYLLTGLSEPRCPECGLAFGRELLDGQGDTSAPNPGSAAENRRVLNCDELAKPITTEGPGQRSSRLA